MTIPENVEAALAAKFQALFPHLDERQRRSMAGAEARLLGHGGIRVVARATGMREGTVSDGVAELECGADPLGQVRRPGGGRKKKELVGPFKNEGRTWRPCGDPVAVRTHDFMDADLGKVTPYGVYDITANAGWVNVGIDHDTAAFAVESIRRWWNGIGKRTYPSARRLLITADAGGSNGYRTRAWKSELAVLAEQTGLAITLAHLPPGTSKWNKIEHRLFSHITMNWRGMPLTSHEVIVNSIAATTTDTGLTVAAELDTGSYPAGTTIPTKQMQALPLDRDNWHGDWNNTLRPEPLARIDDLPDPFDAPSPDLSWLAHPAVTGMTANGFADLVARLLTLHHTQRENRLHQRRGQRPRLAGNGTTGRRPVLTLPDRLLAAMLHYRLALPQTVIAVLFGIAAETVNRRIRDLCRLLKQDKTTLQPAQIQQRTLNDLYHYAEQAGVINPAKIKPAR